MSSSKNIPGKKIKEFLLLAFNDETEYTLDDTKKLL